MQLVIATWERRKDGSQVLVASHGYNTATDTTFGLPSVHPRDLGAVYNPVIDEYVLPSVSPTHNR
jgi:hypothetical protein